MSFSLFTDTSANLPSALAREKNIGVIPFSYFVENEECTCLDTEAFDGADYYGKLRDRVDLPASVTDEEAKAEVLARPAVIAALEGKEPKKIIIVPKKLINIVK